MTKYKPTHTLTPEQQEKRRAQNRVKAKAYYERNREKCIEDQLTRYYSKLEYNMWWRARERSQKKNLEFTITVEDIVIPDTCPVLGTPMENPSLDRVDNSKGYTKENSIVISQRANGIKSDATLAEIEKIFIYMKKHQ